jgi:tetratricopeptide (TPR) repeat protein
MALRLSDSSPEQHQTAGSADLAHEAARLLAARDLSGYRGLLARVNGIEDVHERYRAKKALLEQGLQAAAQAQPAAVAATYAAVAALAAAMLDDEPREPVLLNYFGVALYEIGAWGPAEQIWKAVQRLMPELPHVAGNLAQVRARRKAGATPPQLPPPVKVALQDLSKKGERAAARAVPAEGLKLSLCMIVKDEEEMLPACLEAVAPAVDEIVVVDTGSTDRTVEIAESFGAKVLHHEWNGSFADARNVSVEAASGDWWMFLDADEVLVAEDRERLRALTGRTWRDAFYLVETNHTGDLEDGTAVTHNAMRVFRNRPEYRFKGRVHEQVAHRLPGDLPERFEPTGVRVEHFGYLGAVRDAKEKSRRNVELLERQAADGVDSPFLAFNLGSEYAALGDAPAALREFRRAWDMLRGSDDLERRGFVPSLVSRLTKALRIEGELDAAIAQADEGLAIFPGFTDLVFEQALVARKRGETETARELFERCLEMGDAPSRYSATVGSGTYLAMLQLAELVEPAEAAELLAECLERHPSFLGTVLPFATAQLAVGAAPENVVARVEEAVAKATPSVRFMLGTALYEAGHAEAAEEQFRVVLERQPDSGPARVALCECLLSQSRFAEAAEEARGVSESAPLAPAAGRTEAFALLAAGETGEELDRALARALPHHEAEALSAWAAVARGGQAPPALPAESAPLFEAMLEALLRVEEFDAFGQLVPVFETVGLPWRARREMLAGIYLRRGFLESAADEWIAVCQQGEPDADALVGLAQVAYAQGLRDDARTFAEEAIALAPDSPVAQAAARLAA